MTPVQELFDKLWDADKDKFTWNAILKEMLEKEKEVMCEFATNYVEDECYASFSGAVGSDLSTEEYFDKTKER